MVTGTVMTSHDIKALATLPGREVLLAKLVSVLKALPTRLVQTLNNPIQGVVATLDAVKRTKA
jgi:large subunit ribosomal protein L10